MRLPSLRSTSGLASRAGVGLKPQHYREILESRPDIGFFEVHAENYMGEGGPPHRYLQAVRADYPLSLHGVGLSLGSAQPLDREHLARLRRLVDRYQPHLFSEHLAWSTHGATYFNDLLPLPYTTETLQQVCAHIDQVQDALARPLLLENPATYVQFAESTLAETDFLAQVVERTGCSLLLDVNNVFVSASNHDYDARSYIDAFPLSAVAEIHLAGCSAAADCDARPLLIDDHGSAVKARVWELYGRVLERAGPRPTLIEWDNDVPCWSTLHAEALKAQRVLDGCQSPRPMAGSANAAVG